MEGNNCYPRISNILLRTMIGVYPDEPLGPERASLRGPPGHLVPRAEVSGKSRRRGGGPPGRVASDRRVASLGRGASREPDTYLTIAPLGRCVLESYRVAKREARRDGRPNQRNRESHQEARFVAGIQPPGGESLYGGVALCAPRRQWQVTGSQWPVSGVSGPAQSCLPLATWNLPLATCHRGRAAVPSHAWQGWGTAPPGSACLHYLLLSLWSHPFGLSFFQALLSANFVCRLMRLLKTLMRRANRR